MAQVAVQQPSNLQEMYGSFNPMMWDIASQQVNDQTLGNLINRQQAQQSMDFARQEQPFKLEQLGLANQTTRAQLPGIQAESGLKQNALTRDTATNDAQIKATIAKLAKETSDSDYAVFENGVHQMRASSDPRIRAQGNAMFPYLKAIATERDKLSIQGGNQIAAIREQNKGAKELEQQQYEHGKYLKPGTMSIAMRFNTLTDPIQIDTVGRQLLADEALPDDARQAIVAKLQANVPAYNNAMAAKTASNAGKLNVPEMGGMPAVQQPTAAPIPGAQESQIEQPTKDPLNLSPQDQTALRWARNNPNDPRAKQILNHLGVK